MTKDQFQAETKSLTPGDRATITYRPFTSYGNRIKMVEPITKDGIVEHVDEENITLSDVTLHYNQIVMLRV